MRTGERVEHHVHAFAAGRRHQLRVPRFRMRVEGGDGPQGEEALALLGAPGGRVDFGSAPAGEGHGGLADPAHRGVDEHPLARSKPGEVDERVVGRHVRGEAGRALDRREARGLCEDPLLGQQEAARDAAALDEHDLVARPQAGHAFAGAADPAARLHADLVAQGRALEGEGGQHAEGDHDVAEVEPGRGHVDLDLPRARIAFGERLRHEPRELARAVEAQAPRRVVPGRHRRERLVDRPEAGDQDPALPDRDLALARIGRRQGPETIEILGAADVDQAEVEPPALADLGRDGPDRAPEGVAARIGNVEERAAGDQGEPTIGRRALRPPCREGSEKRDELPGGAPARGIVVASLRAREDVDREDLRRIGEGARIPGDGRRLDPIRRGRVPRDGPRHPRAARRRRSSGGRVDRRSGVDPRPGASGAVPDMRGESSPRSRGCRSPDRRPR